MSTHDFPHVLFSSVQQMEAKIGDLSPDDPQKEPIANPWLQYHFSKAVTHVYLSDKHVSAPKRVKEQTFYGHVAKLMDKGLHATDITQQMKDGEFYQTLPEVVVAEPKGWRENAISLFGRAFPGATNTLRYLVDHYSPAGIRSNRMIDEIYDMQDERNQQRALLELDIP